ncbi:hypothetical protein EOD39_1021 [Acipenser ruthenus]|uniref:Uncharacterized protein n=1 Tax=Acipenser ruthenus TaxID=7906 RepID=A0A444UI75_ACIRT|nr:hypothetical protein EOD39_1021 [Acipenser ruthenus]
MKAMRAMCKEEDYAFLRSLDERRQVLSDEIQQVQKELEERHEERVQRRHQRERREKERQRELEEMQKSDLIRISCDRLVFRTRHCLKRDLLGNEKYI